MKLTPGHLNVTGTFKHLQDCKYDFLYMNIWDDTENMLTFLTEPSKVDICLGPGPRLFEFLKFRNVSENCILNNFMRAPLKKTIALLCFCSKKSITGIEYQTRKFVLWGTSFMLCLGPLNSLKTAQHCCQKNRCCHDRMQWQYVDNAEVKFFYIVSQL